VFVGAGEGPCMILMVGTRVMPEQVQYPVSEIARRHGAGVEQETHDPQQAYAGLARPEPARLELPL
jgi:hypothetical protein